jgi:hypothetical protein
LTDAGALALSEWSKEWVAARSAVDGVLGTSEGAVRR